MTITDIPLHNVHELTLEEKQALAWDMLVEKASIARETHDDTNWVVGRAAVKAAELFAPPDDKPKQRFVLKKFAVDIGMIDNPNYIYDLHDTAAFWPEDVVAQYPEPVWSRFRTCARHCKSLDQGQLIMTKHGHEPVAEIRRIIAAANGEPPKKQRRSFEATITHVRHGDEQGEVGLCIFEADILALQEAAKNDGAVVQVVVTWQPAP